jgi:hypothetical protein
MFKNVNVTDELKRLSQNRFQECMQHLYSSQQKCRVAQGTNMPSYVKKREITVINTNIKMVKIFKKRGT